MVACPNWRLARMGVSTLLLPMKSPAWLPTLSSLLAGSTLLLAACGKTEAPASTSASAAVPATAPAWAKDIAAPLKDKALHLAFVPKGMENVYWKSVEKGLRDAEKDAKAVGVKLDVDWNGPPNEGDRPAQVSLVENYVAQKLNGIILCPMDFQALVSPAEKAHAAGIPLVIVDSPLNYDQTVAFVGTDNEKAGSLAAAELAKELGDKGSVIMMRFLQGSASTNLREKGFLDEIKKHPGITVLDSENYAGDNRDKAFSKGSDLLNTYKGKVDGVFTPNEPSTNGMLRALQQAGLAGKVKFVGFDGGETNMSALAKGEIQALVLQDPYTMGYKGVQTMLEKLAGQKPAANIDTGTVVVTKDNQGTDAVKTLLGHTVM